MKKKSSNKTNLLPRDDLETINATLQRLQSVEENESKLVIKTSDALPSSKQASRNLKPIVFTIGLITICLVGLLFVFLNSNSSEKSNDSLVRITANLETLSDNSGPSLPNNVVKVVTYSSQNGPSESQYWDQALKKVVGPDLPNLGNKGLVLYLEQDTNPQKFVAGTLILDIPFAIKSLRDWEQTPISGQTLVPIQKTGNGQDRVLNSRSYRTIGGVAYIIDEQKLLIGSDVELIESVREEIQQALGQNY